MSSGLHPVWRDYRNRRRVLFAIVAVIPVLAAAGVSLRGADVDPSTSMLLSAWITGFVAAAVWFAGFRCPFCNRAFHWTWLVANPFSDECLHCGFQKWRDPHAARVYGGRR